MHKYLKVSPRGFANEYTIFRVPQDMVREAESVFAGLDDDIDRGGHACWVSAPYDPMSAVDWADRAFVMGV